MNPNDLPQEIKDMIYEDIHQQEDVKTIGQLIIRYTLPPARLQRVGKEFAAEFNQLADADSSLPAERRVGVALLAACRPWHFSVLNTLKRRKAA